MSDEGKKAPEGENKEAQPDPAAAVKQAAGLLWQAARAAGQEIKREVEKAGLKDHIRAAGREIENAAQAAAKELEGFIAKVQPTPPTYSKEWPPAANANEAKKDDEKKKPDEGERADGGAAKEGGKDAKGDPRDMRILIEEEPKK